MIWGNPDLTVGSSLLDTNTVEILNLVYHFLNLPFNVAFMIMSILSKQGWDDDFTYWVQLATFVNLAISGISWLSLSFVPYLIYYFGDTSTISQITADGLWWGTLIYQIIGPLNILAPVFFYFYTLI